MRSTKLLKSVLITLTTASAIAIIPQSSEHQSTPNQNNLQLQLQSQSQSQMSTSPNPSTLTLSDILPRARKINIFASLTRDIASLTTRLETPSTDQNTTLLAPLNSVMQDLPRKPWENLPPSDDTTTSNPQEDQGGDSATSTSDRAARNLRRFVEAHVLPVSPWLEGKENKVRSLLDGGMGGEEMWWEERGGKRVILPQEIVVDGVVGTVGNGEVWGVKGVVNYA